MSDRTPTFPASTMPRRVAQLATSKAGYQIPWFVAIIDGEPDFRVIGPGRVDKAVRDRRCWICGQKMTGPTSAFVIGPMCAVNRVSAEPPSHRECAVYAAQACPFLVNPKKRRREGNKPEGTVAPPGEPIPRNPGVALVWITRHWSSFPDGRGGVLFDVGSATRTMWFAEGRKATRAEVLASIDSGLPILQEVAEQEGAAAEAALATQLCRAMELVPA